MIKTRVVRRLPEADRWNKQLMEGLSVLPWGPSGMLMVGSQKAGRRRYITREAVDRHGATKGCSACAGEGGAHLLRCRDRFERLFKEEAAGRAPEARVPAESAEEPRETEEQDREAEEVPTDEQAPEGAVPAPSVSPDLQDASTEMAYAPG